MATRVGCRDLERMAFDFEIDFGERERDATFLIEERFAVGAEEGMRISYEGGTMVLTFHVSCIMSWLQPTTFLGQGFNRVHELIDIFKFLIH